MGTKHFSDFIVPVIQSGKVNIFAGTITPDSTYTEYDLGSIIINTITRESYICAKNTAPAIWNNIGNTFKVLDTVSPSVTDDAYEIGTIWINTTNNRIFVCTDNSTSAAVWKNIGTVYSSTYSPSASDDSWQLGSIWVNTSSKNVFMCVDNTASNAVWTQMASTYIASRNPTAADDTFSIGNFWFNVTTRALFMCALNSPGSAIWSQLGTSHYTNRNPNANDDMYNLGTVWVNSDTDRIFICASNDSGSAVWKELTTSGAVFVSSVVDTVDPTVNDDAYDVGTIWVNTTTNIVFVCTDGTDSAAVWMNITDNTDEAIFTVGPNKKYATIQAAITAIEPYLEDGNYGYIHVMPGVYEENLTFTTNLEVKIIGNSGGSNYSPTVYISYIGGTDHFINGYGGVYFKNIGLQFSPSVSTSLFYYCTTSMDTVIFDNCDILIQVQNIVNDYFIFDATCVIEFINTNLGSMLQYVDSNDHDCGFFRALNGYTSFIARNSNISLQVEALGGGNLYGVHSYDPASLTSVDMQKSTLQIQTIPIAAITVSLFDDIYEFDAFQSAGAILVADSGDSDIYIFKTTSTSSLVRGIKSSGCDYEISTTIPNNNCYYVRYDLAGVDVVFNSDFVRNTDAVNFVYSNLPWKGSYYSTDDQEMVYSGNFPITLTSASNPSITDDDYRVGSIWVNTSTNKFFVCTDNSTGAAVWQAASDFNHTNEFHIITAGEASAKSFTIAHTPLNPANVTVMIVGGGSVMQYGIDYTIAAASFSWGTYGLDGLLAEGDIVFLSYFY